MSTPVPYHLAQLNIGHARGTMTDPVMADFAAALDEMNGLGERSPGFVWRLKDNSGDATAIQAYPDPSILVNLTVWTSIETLQHYAYRSAHGKFFARRKEWFVPTDEATFVLWWIPAGTIPRVEEAKARLEHLRTHGPTPHAFTFKQNFPAPA